MCFLSPAAGGVLFLSVLGLSDPVLPMLILEVLVREPEVAFVSFQTLSHVCFCFLIIEENLPAGIFQLTHA